MFKSGVLKGLWLEIGSVTLVAFLVYIVNLAIAEGALEPVLSRTTMLALPVLPFQLSSPALGLLLVFRTNTVNTRWRQARMAWERIESHGCNLARQGMAYLDPAEKEEHARRVVALAHLCRAQFRRGAADEAALRDALARLLGRREAARVLAAPSRPAQARPRGGRSVVRPRARNGEQGGENAAEREGEWPAVTTAAIDFIHANDERK